MTIRTLALAGTAVFALAVATPVFAQAQTASPSNSDVPTTTIGKDSTKAADEIDRAAGVKDPVTRSELANAVSLKNVENPRLTLAASEIKNRAGEPIGQVHKVEIGSDGSVQAIDADVGGFLGVGERVVSIDPGRFVYVKDRNILVTRMTKSEIQSLQPTGM